MREATAAAGPLDDPPGVCSGFHGLRVGLGSRNAKAVVVTFPSTIAPAARRRATDVASAAGCRWAKGPAPAVVGSPAASKMSFRATGTPWSAPHVLCVRASNSRWSAVRVAASRSRWTQALTTGSIASIRPRQAASRSTGDTVPARILRAISAAPISCSEAMAQRKASRTSATTSKRPKDGIR